MNAHPSQHAGNLLGGLGSYSYPAWALDVLATVHRADVRGSAGYGHRHPRARWLTLLVTSKIECDCGEVASWQDADGWPFCGRCAEAEGALADACAIRDGKHDSSGIFFGIIFRSFARSPTVTGPGIISQTGATKARS